MTLIDDPFPPPRRLPPRGPSRLTVGLVMVLGLLAGFLLYREVFDRGTVSLEPRLVTARGDLAEDEKSTVELFRRASPSVVYITTRLRSFVPGNANIFETREGTGSGFIWDNAGNIVTNYHVVEGIAGKEGDVTVTLANRESKKAELIGVAPNYDLAVLRIKAPASELPAIPIGESHNLQVGQKTFAIGDPFGLDQTLTTGIVSALGRTLPAKNGRVIEDVIQTDASINPGNSGGPLLDSAGRLIGVTTSIVSPSGTSAGIGFAVPVDTVNRIVPQLLAARRVIRPYLGIRPVTRLTSRQLNIEGVGTLVDPDSPAAKAGFRGASRTPEGTIDPGDVLLRVDGKKVMNPEQLYAAQEKHKPGETIELTFWRDGGEKTLKVVLDPPRE